MTSPSDATMSRKFLHDSNFLMASARVMGRPMNRWHAKYDFRFLVDTLVVCDCIMEGLDSLLDGSDGANDASGSKNLLLPPPMVRKLDSMNFIAALS
jgi:hypothetical protein